MAADEQRDPTIYVDPCPGKKGTDEVWEQCPHCDSGVYNGHSSITWIIRGRGEGTWCFTCRGAGGWKI
ncbi:hypothetical protein F5X71_34730 [Nocardia brasiliensis]|uniref:Uncharacterized protein n=1 Tax=Nocardia brasiliensis TaxID=37326 RepID=A0A6G9Y0Q4_NOCBR|nr:hypothetical protein [Nocardia brasiliensis]QIS06782.1 hypothetical protein F5X71_34730 [Nocardia brasiliensis]